MKGLVLLSGGLDSTVLAALAKASCRELIALSFDYNQRHKNELDSARAVAHTLGVPHIIASLPSFLLSGSSLTFSGKPAKNRSFDEMTTGGIPSTYVPARNTLFLANALSLAESQGVNRLFFGANSYDRNSYPDCRPAYFEAFNRLLPLATKAADDPSLTIQIVTPFVHWTKKEIIEEGLRLKAPLPLSWSCYDPFQGRHCGLCDACLLRKKGFQEAQCFDPTHYIS